MNKIKKKIIANLIVSSETVSGVCNSAAALRIICESDSQLFFTKPELINQLQPSDWPPNRQILITNLAADNYSLATSKFLTKVSDAGHRIVGIIDDHNYQEWQLAFQKTGLYFEDLRIFPISKESSLLKSSGDLLAIAIGHLADGHALELCLSADLADREDYSTHFGRIVHQVIQLNDNNHLKKAHLVKHLANHTQPDQVIIDWLAEYQQKLIEK